jgi:hypothetical protein
MKRLIAILAVVGLFGAAACTPDDGTGVSPAPGVESPAPVDPVDPGMESPDPGMESPENGMESPDDGTGVEPSP